MKRRKKRQPAKRGAAKRAPAKKAPARMAAARKPPAKKPSLKKLLPYETVQVAFAGVLGCCAITRAGGVSQIPNIGKEECDLIAAGDPHIWTPGPC